MLTRQSTDRQSTPTPLQRQQSVKLSMPAVIGIGLDVTERDD